MDKIMGLDRLMAIVAQFRKQKKTIVTTNGAFDILHVGHLKALEFAKRQGDVLIVCLNSDDSIRKYKSSDRPIIPESERAALVSSIIFVDYVVIFDEKTPERILEHIKPDIHVKGSEYKSLPEARVVEKNGGKVVFLERNDSEQSTTKIIDRILKVHGHEN
jgi:D-glycero-beta-D-manno-heptose 1-phosphate adenylyltransferase